MDFNRRREKKKGGEKNLTGATPPLIMVTLSASLSLNSSDDMTIGPFWLWHDTTHVTQKGAGHVHL